MKTATWNGVVIAQSSETKSVEGNAYFPPESINKEFFKEVSKTTVCPWKGIASYYDVVVDGKVNEAAAWYYKEPKSAASEIKGHIAFWKGVVVK